MTSHPDRCALLSCNADLISCKVTCIQCADLPACDITSNRTSIQYCSIEHRKQDENNHGCVRRRTKRDIVRIASVFNGIVMEQREVMFWSRLISSEDLSNSALELVLEGLEEGAPLFKEGLDERMKLAAISYGNCRKTIIQGSGVLALCVEGLPIELKEIEFDKIRAARIIELQRWGEWSQNIECIHTVIGMEPKLGPVHTKHTIDEGVILDPTYHQYWFTEGIEEFQHYALTKSNGNIREVHFGTEFWRYDRDFKKALNTRDIDPRPFYHCEVAIQTTNNAIHSQLIALGGRDMLLEMSHEDYLGAKQDILATLREDLTNLRIKLEVMLYGNASIKDYDELLDEYEGDGHSGCLQALETMTRNVSLSDSSDEGEVEQE